MSYFEYGREKKKIKQLGKKEAKLKVADFCVYQERYQQEVRDKLYDCGLHQDEVEEVLSELISEGFVNEERFAKAYAGGKFRIKKWGRYKITMELKQRKISDYCIRKGLEEIEEAEYATTLAGLVSKKAGSTHEANPFILKRKIANYVIGKGYESELVWRAIETVLQQ